jgi:GntR family transcriptional regulator/MocR family aminotransferase
MSLVHPSAAPRASGATRNLVEALRSQILDGTYAPGEKLPSSRSLAAELGVSRTTVTAAFDQLVSEGYVITRQGSASTVADLVSTRGQADDDGRSDWMPSLSAYAERLLAIAPRPTPGSGNLPYDFRYGNVAGPDFPTLIWKRTTAEVLRMSHSRVGYDDPAGRIDLRQALQAYLWRARGIRCTPEQIVVVSGSQQGLDLCSRLLIEPEDRVVIEDPGYRMACAAFAAAGARLAPVPCDEHGLLVEQLPSESPVSRPIALAYVTPSHQYPLGGVLSATRRERLVMWSQMSGAMILEDDYDGEYRYDAKPIPPLYQIGEGRVIYLGTFSKTLSPTLRLGYLVLPPKLVDIFKRAKEVADRHSPCTDQDVLARLLATGAYERHVRKMRRANAHRRDALLSALTQSFGMDIEIQGASAGLHVVVWFRKHVDEDEITRLAYHRGIGVYPIGPLYNGSRPERAGFVFGFASLSPRMIAEGIRLLHEVFRSTASERSPTERPVGEGSPLPSGT